ncbi:MAG: DUF3347 domain-containing protein [Chitinophagaceae bacterium]
MKKLIILMFIPGVFVACNNTEEKAENNPEVVAATGTTRNSDVFNESFQKMLVSYYAVKDALVEYDTIKANEAARQLAVNADSLKVNEIKNDSAGDVKKTAKDYAGTITGSALGLAGETDLANKKKEFSMISNAMYDLVRTVKYHKEKIYHQHCPMALNESDEAYWLSNNSAVVNPYLGKKHPKFRDAMLACGDVTDSLDFSR